MKLVKNFALAVLLASALSVNALAGEVPMPGAINPPPPAKATSDEPTKTLSYEEPYAPDVTTETSDYLFYEALAALLSVY